VLTRIRCSMIVAVVADSLGVRPAASQVPAYRAPRTADGKPDLNGIWQALNSANWDIQDHSAGPGPSPALGAAGAVPPGVGVVEGDEIPYLPRRRRRGKRISRIGSLAIRKSVLSAGIPRGTYAHPFQIVQGSKSIMIAYQYAGAARNIPMDDPGPSPTESWMGWSAGRWEGILWWSM
jgi:hypothetical protein